jgi:hypothetical protein
MNFFFCKVDLWCVKKTARGEVMRTEINNFLYFSVIFRPTLPSLEFHLEQTLAVT